MNPLELAEVSEYANSNIVHFHQRRITSLEKLALNRLLTKNPYNRGTIWLLNDMGRWLAESGIDLSQAQ